MINSPRRRRKKKKYMEELNFSVQSYLHLKPVEILFFIVGELDINHVKCHLYYIMVATIIKGNI